MRFLDPAVRSWGRLIGLRPRSAMTDIDYSYGQPRRCSHGVCAMGGMIDEALEGNVEAMPPPCVHAHM